MKVISSRRPLERPANEGAVRKAPVLTQPGERSDDPKRWTRDSGPQERVAAGVFADGAGKESNREAEINELYTKIGADGRAGFFITEVRAMNRAERVAMVERGRSRPVGATAMYAARIGPFRDLSQAGGAGSRRAGVDAVARRAVSGDTVLRLTADDGGAAPDGPSDQHDDLLQSLRRWGPSGFRPSTAAFLPNSSSLPPIRPGAVRAEPGARNLLCVPLQQRS
jgi:hypothetical protein